MRPFDPTREPTGVEVLVALLALEFVNGPNAPATRPAIARVIKRPPHLVVKACEKFERFGLAAGLGRFPRCVRLTQKGRDVARRVAGGITPA